MKQASTQHTAQPAPHRRPRRSAVASPPVQGTPLPDGPDSAPAESPLFDGETRDAQIHRLAYARYLSNGCVDGHALDDWLAAEAEVAALDRSGDGGVDRPPGA